MAMTENAKEIYATQASDYGGASYWRVDEEKIAKKYFVGKNVLVLGCGGGRTLKPIRALANSVTAIDIVPEMVEQAKKRVVDSDIEVLEMDAVQLGFKDSVFDIVFFPFHGIDYVSPHIYAAVSEAARVVKSDGVFIFNSHNRFFVKKLHRFFVGHHDDYRGLQTYRTDLGDRLLLRKYFKKVRIKQRISYLPWSSCNWKDTVYKSFPFFSKSTYFICSQSIKHD